MSPRAAWRLEALGFTDVYDYVAGKVEWLAYALPREGTAIAQPIVADALRRDAPTARVDEDLAVVQLRTSPTGWDICVVVNDERVVLGLLGRSALKTGTDGSVADVMTEGPSTIRPNKRLKDEGERMAAQNLTSAVVTTPDGRLVGVLLRSDAERLA